MDLDKLLDENWTYSSGGGHCTIEGYTLTGCFLDIKNNLDNLGINEDDVWICTFPKTGTTWTQEMVWMILNNLDFEKGQQVQELRCGPFVEFSGYFGKAARADLPIYMRDSIGFYKSYPSPKMVKTHLPYELLPKQIISGEKKPKIICVTRNPKDTCVSFYYHAKLLEGYRGTFEEFCELFLGGKALSTPYSKHILSYWKHRDSPNILFLKYEDMKKDLSKAIVDTATFLGKKLDRNQIEILSKHLTFDSMKENRSVNKEILSGLKRVSEMTTDPEGKFMRSGTVGSYKLIMDEKMSRRFDEWIEKEFKGTEFSF